MVLRICQLDRLTCQKVIKINLVAVHRFRVLQILLLIQSVWVSLVVQSLKKRHLLGIWAVTRSINTYLNSVSIHNIALICCEFTGLDIWTSSASWDLCTRQLLVHIVVDVQYFSCSTLSEQFCIFNFLVQTAHFIDIWHSHLLLLFHVQLSSRFQYNIAILPSTCPSSL